MASRLTDFTTRHPFLTMGSVAAVALLLAAFAAAPSIWPATFPGLHAVQIDTDPENMLDEDEPIRLFHHAMKEALELHDMVVVGVVNEDHPDGVFNPESLARVHELTEFARGLRGAAIGSADPSAGVVEVDLIAPSTVDNIEQAGPGTVRFEWLMAEPPATREEALAVREKARRIPFLEGTLVSEDGKAIALYIPIIEKSYSYNVANLVTALTSDWGGDEEVYITGLPVAEDTFGTEMLVQMATSAPLAGLAIFLLLYFFFRRLSLVIAPMVVAVITVITTMGLLIGQGFDVHILSSMIAIFLMPIAVADSVHILSEFYDSYHRFNDKAQTLRHVIGHLFKPMLYTSLTTMAGFASLGLTPIPPVRVFGLHVAFGVGLAWILTITLIPAYITLWVPERSLQSSIPTAAGSRKQRSRLDPFLEWMGSFSYQRWKLILVLALALIGMAGYGISKIQVNDNPVRWFTKTHRIRVADRVLNEHFGGTYTAYLTLAPTRAKAVPVSDKAAVIREEAQKRFGDAMPAAVEQFLAALAGQEQRALPELLVAAAEEASRIDQAATKSWNELADAVNYLDPEGLTPEFLVAAILSVEGATDADRTRLLDELRQNHWELAGALLQERALEIADRFTGLSFREFVYEMEANLNAPPFKQPKVLHYVERLQERIVAIPRVGKTSSVVDSLKKANYELNYLPPPANSVEDDERNESFYSVPSTPSAVAQVFTQLEGMKKKDSLFHLVTRDYEQANIWVQLTSGDNSDMQHVLREVESYVADNPPPAHLAIGWAGLTYINVVWQDKMVVGMLGALASSFFVVLVMMMLLFRSPLFGLLSMIPLSMTIAMIYGIIGLVGKDYDMPVAVLSALTLGLSVDFAIHFLQRARETFKAKGNWKDAITEMFKEPAMAISRNAIVISVGFTPLLVAPLVPYKTVGFFLATIMAVSWLATLFLLAALATMLQRFLFKQPTETKEVS